MQIDCCLCSISQNSSLSTNLYNIWQQICFLRKKSLKDDKLLPQPTTIPGLSLPLQRAHTVGHQDHALVLDAVQRPAHTSSYCKPTPKIIESWLWRTCLTGYGILLFFLKIFIIVSQINYLISDLRGSPQTIPSSCKL